MCGCTCVGRPAASACAFRRERTWLGREPGAAAADEERRLVRRARPRRAAPATPRAPRSAGPPTGTLRRLLPLPSTCALASAASIQPAAPRAGDDVEADQLADAQAAAVEQLGDAGVARRQRAASPRVVALRDQRHRLVDRQRLGQRLRGARRAHAVDRVGGDQAVAAEPAVEAAPGREHERDAARRQAGAVQLRRPAADVVRLAPRAAAAPAAPAKRCSRSKRLAVERQRARGEAALDREVLEMARDVGVARRRRRSSLRSGCMRLAPACAAGRRALTLRQQPRQRGARDLADARQELGAHVGGVARRIGRGEHEQAEGAGAGSRGAAGSARSTAPAPARRATAPPRSRRWRRSTARRGWSAKLLTSSLTPRGARQRRRTPRRRPRRGSPPAGSGTGAAARCTSTSGRSAALAVSISARVQRCSLSAMATFSWP